MARKGRPKKSKEQKAKDAIDRTAPSLHIAERRRLFSFVQPPANQRQDGRNGEIDSEVCDAIGQLCALGLLDHNGYDAIELRDKGRFWGGHYVRIMGCVGPKMASYERKDRSTPTGALTGEDLLFDRMDEGLPSFERQVLLSLIVDPLIGHAENVPWAQSLIDEALLERGRIPRAMRFADANDRELLKAAIRGLCVLCEGSLRPRWERAA